MHIFFRVCRNLHSALLPAGFLCYCLYFLTSTGKVSYTHLKRTTFVYLIPFGVSALLTGVKVENQKESSRKQQKKYWLGTTFPDSASFLHQTSGCRDVSDWKCWLKQEGEKTGCEKIEADKYRNSECLSDSSWRWESADLTQIVIRDWSSVISFV